MVEWKERYVVSMCEAHGPHVVPVMAARVRDGWLIEDGPRRRKVPPGVVQETREEAEAARRQAMNEMN